ncbi:MAG: hypothetical protein GY853_16785 [PVC group bacterium]|nr:hypothetical protein [PVC group bacterium]
MYSFLKQQSHKSLALCQKYCAGYQNCDPVLKLTIIAFLAGYFKQPEKKNVVKVDRIFVPFLCPAMDRLNLKSLFMATSVKKLNPMLRKDQRKLQIVFQYDMPFSRKVFNYTKELRAIDSLVQLKRILHSTCNCENSAFIYQPAGHVITGDLNIIEDKLLRDILCKGTKYRLPKTCAPAVLKSKICQSITALVNSMANRSRIPVHRFMPWYREIERILQSHIRTLIVE